MEVLKSTDDEALGKYLFDFYPITIGRSQNCDLIINDSAIEKKEISLNLLDNKVFIQSFELDGTFNVNGMKTKGKRILQEGDLIKIGESSIKLLKVDLSQNEHVQVDNFDEEVMQAEGKTSGVVELINLLEEELIEREL